MIHSNKSNGCRTKKSESLRRRAFLTEKLEVRNRTDSSACSSASERGTQVQQNGRGGRLPSSVVGYCHTPRARGPCVSGAPSWFLGGGGAHTAVLMRRTESGVNAVSRAGGVILPLLESHPPPPGKLLSHNGASSEFRVPCHASSQLDRFSVRTLVGQAKTSTCTRAQREVLQSTPLLVSLSSIAFSIEPVGNRKLNLFLMSALRASVWKVCRIPCSRKGCRISELQDSCKIHPVD